MAQSQNTIQQSINTTNLADLLERILDKGIVIAGDIKVKLVEVELLTIQIQLVICSVDKAKEIGIDWWNKDQRLLAQSQQSAIQDSAMLEAIHALEQRVCNLEN
jgi:hypothetical protein